MLEIDFYKPLFKVGLTDFKLEIDFWKTLFNAG